MFPGSSNQNTIEEGFLREPISARFIRINPQQWNTNIAVRFDVIGCNVEGDFLLMDIEYRLLQ